MIRALAWEHYKKGHTERSWGYDDLVQEGVITYLTCLRTYDPDCTYPFARYLATALRNNFYNDVKRHKCKPVQASEAAVSLVQPRRERHEHSFAQRMRFLAVLSQEATLYLRCVLSPPAELTEFMAARAATGRPWCRDLRRAVVDWLGWSNRRLERVEEELREKVVFSEG